MKNPAILIIVLILIFLCAAQAFALNINGEEVRVFSGARRIQPPREQINAKVAAFTTGVSISEVANFYSAYFSSNGYQTIGGIENNGSYNVMAQKGKVKFSLRIYPSRGATIIEFIW